MKLVDLAKAIGSLSSSLAEATNSDLGVIIMCKRDEVGVFIGGQADADKETIVKDLNNIIGHLKVLSEKVASGEAKCDGDVSISMLGGTEKKAGTDNDISLLA